MKKRKMTEEWKSVSDPYYIDGNARVDYEMANPLPERSAKYPVYRYSYRGVVFSALFPAGAIAGGMPMNYDNSVGYVDIASSWIDKNVRDITIKLRKEDVDTGTKTYIDEVLRIIPEKPTPTPTPTPTPLPRSPPCDSYGDIDDDGYVTQADVNLISQYIASNIELSFEQLRRADVNGDGTVDIGDALAVGQYADGTIDTFPICELTPTPTATPTGTPTATPTMTPTVTPTPGPSIITYLYCLLPRIFTQNPIPRIATKDMIPRISCLMETGKQ